jgi:hypothetical protein
VLRLRHALYGLRQAPRASNRRLETELRSRGFLKSDAEAGLRILHEKNGTMLSMFYVDNGLVAAGTDVEADALVELVASIFEITALVEPKDFLGIEISQDNSANTITITQKSKSSAFAAELDPEECYPAGRGLCRIKSCSARGLVDYVLLGLPSSYHTIRTIVGDSKESNLEEVLRRLVRYQEQELKQGSDTPGSGVALSSQEGRHSSQATHHQRQQKKRDYKPMTCYNCNKKGHIAVNCRLPPMKNKDGDSSHSSHGRALIATALAASAHESATNWVVDTGATHHMTSDPSCLTHIQQWQIKTIVFGGGDTVSVIGQGDCLVKSFVASKCHVLTLKNVLLLDKLSFNLLSVAQMTAKGAHVHVTADLCLVKDGGEVLMEAAKRDGLFKAILRPASSPAK